LDAILENAKAQLNVLTNNVETEYSVSGAVVNWNKTVEGIMRDWRYYLQRNYDWFGGMFPGLPVGLNPIVNPIPITPPVPVGNLMAQSAYMQADTSDQGLELITEIKALKEEVCMLRAETRANLEVNTTTSKVLTRVAQEGDAFVVTQVA
ncbi:MAG: hypothetical protein ACRDBG_06400, partial [Waterburya sp.]